MMSKFSVLLALLINGNMTYARSGSGGGTMPQRAVQILNTQIQNKPIFNLSQLQSSRLNSLFHQNNDLADNFLLSISIASFIKYESDVNEIKRYKAFLVDHVALQMLKKNPNLDEEKVFAAVSEFYKSLYEQRDTRSL